MNPFLSAASLLPMRQLICKINEYERTCIYPLIRIQAALLPPALDSCLIALVKAITENPEDAYVSHAVHFIVNILRILRKMPF
jgi:hypothetical protein